LSIPRENLITLFDSDPDLKDRIYASLVNHHSYNKLQNVSDTVLETEEAEIEIGKMKIFGWLLAIILPALILIFGNDLGFDWKTKIFLTVASSTVVMWIFRLAHEFIPSIFAILVILILDVAPPSVALSGFTSGSFFMAMSIFGISSLLVSSGLTYRIVINLFRLMPMSQGWHSYAIFITGIILTPLLPSANGRISLATPIVNDMTDSLGYKPKGKAATRLGVSAFSGFTLFSSVFLSSKAIHFVVFGLLPAQVREQFNWGYWFYASLVAGAVMLVLYIIFSSIIFRNTEVPRLSKELINAQHKLLGPVTSQEWAALGGILLFAIGIATSSIHKIQLPWIGLTVLYIVLASGFLKKKEFRINIDWTFLIYLATLIGLVKSMSYIGLDKLLGSNFMWLGNFSGTNIYLFILLLSGCIFFMRLFIPNNATVAILASVLFPIAGLSGINPWIVGFIILIMSDAWVMPYQSTYYVLFDSLTRKKALYNQKLIVKFNLMSILFRLAAVYASIPFWRAIGIL
jgi:DASS family divalent anion:Na+ symporter